jgi:hypothetical protein
MFYVKNVPSWERAARIVVGVLALAFSVMNWNGSALLTAAGICGAILSLTGLFGFCPMCKLAGRKLAKRP